MRYGATDEEILIYKLYVELRKMVRTAVLEELERILSIESANVAK